MFSYTFEERDDGYLKINTRDDEIFQYIVRIIEMYSNVE